MKKFFKTLLIALIIVPALCLVTACGGGGDTGSQTQEQQTQQRYEVLKTAMGKMSQKGSYTVESINEQTMNTTTTNSTKTNGTWVNARATTDEESEKTKNVITLDATNGLYADNEYEWVTAQGTTAAHYEKNQNDGTYITTVTEGNETKHVSYRIDSSNGQPTYHATYVSSDHAQHVYSFATFATTFSMFIGGDTAAETLAKLKEFVPSMATEELPIRIDLDDFNKEITGNLVINQNGINYTLVVTLGLSLTQKVDEQEENSTTTEEPQTTLALTGTAEMSISFTSEQINSYAMNLSMDATSTAESTATKVTTQMQGVNNAGATITYQYRSSEMPTDFSAFSNEDIETAQVSVQYYVDEQPIYPDLSVDFGTDATTQVKAQTIPTYLIPEHATADSWYKDKACTQKVAASDTFNFKSWESPKFYAKLNVDEGYALVKIRYGEEYSAEMLEMMKLFGYEMSDNFNAYQTQYIAVELAEGNTFALPTQATIDEAFENSWLGPQSLVKVTDNNGITLTTSLIDLEEGKIYTIRVYIEEATTSDNPQVD